LSLKLLVDEDSQGKLLVNLLKRSGHNVKTVNEAGFRTAADADIFDYAIAERRTLLTQNCSDFAELAVAMVEGGGHHSGVLLIYKETISPGI
jgi:predicted nuclease of predicted toxin-antitoxin system